MTTQTQGRVIFTGTSQWWGIVSDGEIETGDTWPERWEQAAAVAGLDLDDEECWVARVEGDTGRHTAIRAGDYACCQGVGSDVVFVRLEV